MGKSSKKKKQLETKRRNVDQLHLMQEEKRLHGAPDQDRTIGSSSHHGFAPFGMENFRNKPLNATIGEGSIGFSSRSHNRDKRSSTHRSRMRSIRDYYIDDSNNVYFGSENSAKSHASTSHNGSFPSIILTTKESKIAASEYPSRSYCGISRDSLDTSESRNIENNHSSPGYSNRAKSSHKSRRRSGNHKNNHSKSIRKNVPFQKKHTSSPTATMDPEDTRIFELNQKMSALMQPPASRSNYGDENCSKNHPGSSSNGFEYDDLVGRGDESLSSNGHSSCFCSSRKDKLSSAHPCSSSTGFDDDVAFDGNKNISISCDNSRRDSRAGKLKNHKNNPFRDTIRSNNKSAPDEQSVVVIVNHDQHNSLKKSVSSTGGTSCTEAEDMSNSTCSYYFDEPSSPSDRHACAKLTSPSAGNSRSRLYDEREQDNFGDKSLALYLSLYGFERESF